MVDQDAPVHRRSAVGSERPGPGPGTKPERGAQLDAKGNQTQPDLPDPATTSNGGQASEGGQISEGGSALQDPETAHGGADAVPDTHG